MKVSKESLSQSLDREAERLAGPDIGKKIRTRKVLEYVVTALGATLVERIIEEEDYEADQLL